MSDRFEPSFGNPISKWYRHFAWWPVETLDRGWRWGRFVWCRRVKKHSFLPGGGDFWFQYVVDKE